MLPSGLGTGVAAENPGTVPLFSRVLFLCLHSSGEDDEVRRAWRRTGACPPLLWMWRGVDVLASLRCVAECEQVRRVAKKVSCWSVPVAFPASRGPGRCARATSPVWSQ